MVSDYRNYYPTIYTFWRRKFLDLLLILITPFVACHCYIVNDYSASTENKLFSETGGGRSAVFLISYCKDKQ